MADKFPIGALMEKGLSVKSGQTHVQKFMPDLLKMILEGKLDTTFLISHRLDLEDAPKGYKMFKEQQNDVTKVVLKPGTRRLAGRGAGSRSFIPSCAIAGPREAFSSTPCPLSARLFSALPP